MVFALLGQWYNFCETEREIFSGRETQKTYRAEYTYKSIANIHLYKDKTKSRSKYKFFVSQHLFDVFICSFRCFYCYQKALSRGRLLNPKIHASHSNAARAWIYFKHDIFPRVFYKVLDEIWHASPAFFTMGAKRGSSRNVQWIVHKYKISFA